MKGEDNGTQDIAALCIKGGPQDYVLYIVAGLWALGRSRHPGSQTVRPFLIAIYLLSDGEL